MRAVIEVEIGEQSHKVQGVSAESADTSLASKDQIEAWSFGLKFAIRNGREVDR
jgi:hypothetical protein